MNGIRVKFMAKYWRVWNGDRLVSTHHSQYDAGMAAIREARKQRERDAQAALAAHGTEVANEQL